MSARGEVWRVVSRTRHADCEALALARLTSDLKVGPAGDRTLLLPFDRVTVQPTHRTPQVVGNKRWAQTVLGLLARIHPFGALGSAAGARIDLLPFQMEPALAMLRHGHTRVLIADEVASATRSRRGCCSTSWRVRSTGFEPSS